MTSAKPRFLEIPPEASAYSPQNEHTPKNHLVPPQIQQTFGTRFTVSASEVSPSRRSSTSEGELSLPCSPKLLEHPPIIDFYQLTKPSSDDATKRRPTMSELIHGTRTSVNETLEDFEDRNTAIIQAQLKPPKPKGNKIHPSEPTENSDIKNSKDKKKFGWIEGVLIRCAANIFGVMLYLRMSWVAGHAGIIMGSMIVLLGALITLITALSTSAICTNGSIKGGGAYYLISRSLGPQFGGAIGVIFSLANAVAVAMYIVGFAEFLVELLGTWDIKIIDGNINDVRIIGIITCLVLLAIIFGGLGFEAKMQVVLLGIVIASIINFYIGSIIPPSPQKQLKGMTGYSGSTFIENLYPSFREGQTFFSVFAIYFPAATGIMAGANISGDLKNSATAIPKGTILAILGTTFVYLSVIWISGATVIRDADGVVLPTLLDIPETTKNDGWLISELFKMIFGEGTRYYAKPTCVKDLNNKCHDGLMNNFQVFELIAWWSPLVIAGIMTSTLSSALLSLVSAPKVFQAVAQDKLFPYISHFATGFGSSKEPQKAYLLTCVISCAVVLVGDLNAIAPIISNFYLSTYVLINFACFDTSFAKSPGFRPSFKYYNQYVSLLGSILCLCVMFVISWLNALVTFMFFGLLFLYMSHRKPDVNWGSSNQAHAYRNALQYAQKLETTDEHVKNYRPQILVLSGNPAARPSLIDFTHAITKGNSLLVCGHVLPYKLSDNVYPLMQTLSDRLKLWFQKKHVRGFYFPVANTDFRAGTQCLMQGSGLGKLKPNIVFIGFKQDWNVSGIDEVNGYFHTIQDAFDCQLAVCIFRNGHHGFDYSDLIQQKKVSITSKLDKSRKLSRLVSKSHKKSLGNSEKNISTIDADIELGNFGEPDKTTINRFNSKISKGVIDVWWLYDDGGLSLLIPYLLTKEKSYLEGAKLRVFTLSLSAQAIKEEERKLAALLAKFRIKFAEVTILQDVHQKPQEKTISSFESLIKPFITKKPGSQEGLISTDELESNQEKTWRTLRTVEYLHKYSSRSDLIVVTLPVPRKGLISSCLYMAWIDMMTRNLPPTLLVRGNQTSVLTFYS